MHELSITRNIVGIVADQAAGRPVKAVRLQIGKLSGIEVEAVRFCFDVCAAGTSVQGAALEIDEPPGRGQCQGCDKELELDRLVGICPCEERAKVKITGGEELLVKSMEV